VILSLPRGSFFIYFNRLKTSLPGEQGLIRGFLFPGFRVKG
jgi:hypothetical protein